MNNRRVCFDKVPVIFLINDKESRINTWLYDVKRFQMNVERFELQIKPLIEKMMEKKRKFRETIEKLDSELKIIQQRKSVK
ncbi:hypothetical protein DD592_26350 [Enterobacter cloacae complex sp. 2DZ2F20B]|nr:hypothetical protein DD603_24100 [Enterobacter cloacae complex sp. 2DZ2F2B]RYA71954.1 hypothetical protein DD592_26350 [Enterobacter cloacae complex sp. 2DZ2F20B]